MNIDYLVVLSMIFCAYNFLCYGVWGVLFVFCILYYYFVIVFLPLFDILCFFFYLCFWCPWVEWVAVHSVEYWVEWTHFIIYWTLYFCQFSTKQFIFSLCNFYFLGNFYLCSSLGNKSFIFIISLFLFCEKTWNKQYIKLFYETHSWPRW